MLFAKLLALSFAVHVTAQQAIPVPYPCVSKDFCAKHWSYEKEHLVQAKSNGVAYHVLPSSVQVDDQTATIQANMDRQEDPQGIQLAPQVTLALSFYQNGILRVVIDEPNSDRFRISREGISVVDEQLKEVQNLASYVTYQEDGSILVKDIPSDDQKEFFSFEITMSPFKIEQRVNDVLIMIVNPKDTLWVEHGDAEYTPDQMAEQKDDQGNSVWPNLDFQQSIALGFFFNSEYMFGLPEREFSFRLPVTDEWTGPYRLFNRGLSVYGTNNSTNLYGSAPYLTSHALDSDASVAWLNSADTFVDLYSAKMSGIDGTLATFVSEAGAIEFFTMGSSLHPQRVQKSLADITGYIDLPPIHALGFHFSKWAPISADMVIERSQNFTKYGFPVDNFWMDVDYAEDYHWFEFNKENFTASAIERMKQEVIESERRLTTIIDPHIQASQEYFVYADGMKLMEQEQTSENITNIFMREPKGGIYYGDERPGNCSWMDFLNENAQDYWGGLYSKFEGTNYLFNAWNDVNDPAVFNGPMSSMALTNVHVKADGTKILHRDVHNAYGTIEQKASYHGILKRDNYMYRPFILSRSFFLGAQKYGPTWTGDNQAIFGELKGSVNEILALGVSGHPFVGADIPGYKFTPPEDLFIEMYQLGTFYPFFRAHNEHNSQDREPWLQTERVQKVIRNAIFLRYSLANYFYTCFYQAATEGQPLVRAMWHEFPKDVKSMDISTQFMFGDSLLIAPKLNKPAVELEYKEESQQMIHAYLPQQELWYFWYDGQLHSGEEEFSRFLPDNQQGIYVRGGKIVPTLAHQNELSLLKAMKNDITLKVYLDELQDATGDLYLDDGESFDYKTKDEHLSVHFVFEGDSLFIANNNIGSYPQAKDKFIKDIEIVGYNKDMPTAIYKPEYFEAQEFYFDESKSGIVIKDVNIPIQVDGEEEEDRWILVFSHLTQQ